MDVGERGDGVLRRPGSILLISCYELGHQPLSIASAAAFLERAGYTAGTLDISLESFDVESVVPARFVGISVPMHTALRLGVRVAEQIRQTNPTCHICLYGLYASLNAEYLLERVADSVIGGECETPLLGLIQALEEGQPGKVEGVHRRSQPAGPFLKRLPFPVPSRGGLPALAKYARLEHDGVRGLTGYVEASRGCLHMCLHCPIPPVYGGRFFVVPRGIVLADIRRLVRSGASHITFGDPDFLNGPGHSLAIVRAMHEEFPALSFDFTAKVEHILERRGIFPELAALGCVFMVSAVESLSDTCWRTSRKGTRAPTSSQPSRSSGRPASHSGPRGSRSPRGRRWMTTSTSSSSSRPRGSSITWTRCSTRSGFLSRRAPPARPNSDPAVSGAARPGLLQLSLDSPRSPYGSPPRVHLPDGRGGDAGGGGPSGHVRPGPRARRDDGRPGAQ